MIYGVDIDGVLADFNSGFISLIKEMTGKELPKVSSTYPAVWNYHREDSLGVNKVTNKEETAVWERIKAGGFWRSLDITKDGRDALSWLNMMRYEGHQIYFITSRPGVYAKYLTEDWLSQYGYRNPTVLVVQSDRAKGQLAAGLGFDVFIDDKPNNCLEVAVFSKAAVFLVNQPYNQGDVFKNMSGADDIVRVDSALEALERSIGSKNGVDRIAA